MPKTKVAIIGAGFSANIHAESYNRFVPDAELVAVCARDAQKTERFAAEHRIAKAYCNYDQLLAESGAEVIDICVPNYLHHEICMKAAKAGKHVIVEKPLAITIEQADEMIAACKQSGKLLCYAEELCFAPKYEKVRKLVEEGAVGDIYMLKQAEKHSGPHSRWFYEPEYSGGGVLMDMGCHALAWFLWMNKGAKPISVTSKLQRVLHKSTDAEDNTVVIVEFDNGVIGIAEDSWARHGGMDDRIEVYGTEGVSYADLFQGNSALTYSRKGYGYAAEKAETTTGWTFTMFEEAFNQGYPHELKHFIECVRENKEPVCGGEMGRLVMEMLYAAYASGKSGAKVMLPFTAKVEKPIDLWL